MRAFSLSLALLEKLLRRMTSISSNFIGQNFGVMTISTNCVQRVCQDEIIFQLIDCILQLVFRSLEQEGTGNVPFKHHLTLMKVAVRSRLFSCKPCQLQCPTSLLEDLRPVPRWTFWQCSALIYTHVLMLYFKHMMPSRLLVKIFFSSCFMLTSQQAPLQN